MNESDKKIVVDKMINRQEIFRSLKKTNPHPGRI